MINFGRFEDISLIQEGAIAYYKAQVELLAQRCTEILHNFLGLHTLHNQSQGLAPLNPQIEFNRV